MWFLSGDFNLICDGQMDAHNLVDVRAYEGYTVFMGLYIAMITGGLTLHIFQNEDWEEIF